MNKTDRFNILFFVFLSHLECDIEMFEKKIFRKKKNNEKKIEYMLAAC